MNPYQSFATSFAQLVAQGKSLPLGGIPSRGKQKPQPNAPVALIFSPHPDDECLIGGFALRLMRETGMKVVNVAVTQGSNKNRQEPRLRWSGAVNIVADILLRYQPRAIFFPHETDWNITHIGTHFLVLDALDTLPRDFECLMIETEYWAPMVSPNLMVESSVDDVADLLAALSFHVGEVRRNPYHLRMPAWLQDNVRRGAEVIGGQGGPAPDFTFATLYRLRQWKNGHPENIYPGGKQISAAENSGVLFNLPA